MWQEFIDEMAALGYKAFVRGPEIHLALPFLTLALALLILFGGKTRR